MQPLIFDIQKFSVHDGSGIRTTVFFKGCPLRCRWCHNPESQSFETEWMWYKERCTGCGRCSAAAVHDAGFAAAEKCAFGARVQVGEEYSLDKLLGVLFKDRIFYDVSGGGVTLSGGEVMAQDIGYVAELCRRLHRRGIAVAIDTCGHVDYARFEAVLPYVDEFLYDIKAVDCELHREYTGVSNELILENAARLSRAGANMHIRIPTIPGVNDGAEMRAIIEFVCANISAAHVSLLPYHRLGADKSGRLGAGPWLEPAQRTAYPLCAPVDFFEPAHVHMEELAQLWHEAGVTAHIGG